MKNVFLWVEECESGYRHSNQPMFWQHDACTTCGSGHGGGHGWPGRANPAECAGLASCARNSCGVVIFERLIPSDWGMIIGSCGNKTGRGKNWGNWNWCGTGCSSDTQSVKNVNLWRGHGPAAQRGTVQTKAKTNTSSRHFRDTITSDILVFKG